MALRLLAIAGALLAIFGLLLGAAGTAVATVSDAQTVTYTYNGLHGSTALAGTAFDRGPPLPTVDVQHKVADNPAPLTTPLRPRGDANTRVYDYDAPAVLAQTDGVAATDASGTRKLGASERPGALSSPVRAQVAANTARSRAFQFGNLPPGVSGFTDELGNITIQRGLTGKAFEETLRHETVHSVLTPRAPLNKLTVGLYNKSGLYRYAEEALAEGYAIRSLRAGLAFPLREGYVSGARLGLEAGGSAVALGGAAYWWGQ